MMAARGADGGTGSARRRRERRLRSWLRHEQQSIAAVLATVTHHSFDKLGTASGVPRNRKTATRAGKGEEYETHFTAKFRKTPLPQTAATKYYPMTDDEGGELSAGVRPAPLEEGRPQEKLQVFTCPSLCSDRCSGPDSAVLCLEVPQMQFLAKVVDMPVLMQHWCICPDSADLDVTGAVLGQGCRARVVQRQVFRHDSQH